MCDLETMSSSDKLNFIIMMNTTLQIQLEEQAKLIQQLQEENKKILADTTKMATHIEFINASYARIRQSSFFRTILG